MKHPGDTAKVLRCAALLSLCAAIMTACLDQPKILRCDEQTGCRKGFECYQGRCIQPNVCGNGKIEIENGEQCDEGDTVPGDGCGSSCRYEVCGNDIVDPGEDCDDGDRVAGDGCGGSCRYENCGNAFTDPREDCDTGGNSESCDADCTPVVCGDSFANPAAGEECDTGDNSEECDLDCTFAACGDGVFNSEAEICDTGGNSESCDGDCTPVACGDSFTNPAVGEECDTGGNSESCDFDCTAAVCGDGVVNHVAGEACDTGGNTATCDADCTAVQCGDGFVNSAAGEQCDDGNSTDGDSCSPTCGLFEIPNQCATGPDPISGSAWVVCDADVNTAWISAVSGGGIYRPDLICQSLGYSRVNQSGGNLNNVCGHGDPPPTSCFNPGSRVFDGGNGCVAPQLCFTVIWECGR